MINDNQPPSNIVGITKKAVAEPEAVMHIFVKDDMVGIQVKEPLNFFKPEAALQICMVLASAIQAIADKG